MTAQICATMTSCLHSADVMEIALTYFVHDEINMIPCTVGHSFQTLKPLNPPRFQGHLLNLKVAM